MNKRIVYFFAMSYITRQILCTTTPTHPDDRVDLWEGRKQQAQASETDDNTFPQRHPATVSLSGLRRVCAFFRGFWR